MTEEEKKQKEAQYIEDMLDGTARFMFNVFNTKSGNYNENFEELLLQGGGGNSMFVNCWAKPSSFFVRKRISGKAKETIANLGFASINDVPPEYKYNNAKGAENRKTVGKLLHLDHSPGNVKVLHLIRDKCREFNPDTDNYDMIIRTLKEYFKTIQTLDWITIEQDDIRTYKTDSDGPSKKEKDMMSHEERDNLLNDIWEDL